MRGRMRATARKRGFTASSRPRSVMRATTSRPTRYWDDYFALSAWRDCEGLAREIGDAGVAAYAREQGAEFAANLARSIRRQRRRWEGT